MVGYQMSLPLAPTYPVETFGRLGLTVLLMQKGTSVHSVLMGFRRKATSLAGERPTRRWREMEFELPVPGRIFSAAMRSQVISRCSSPSPVCRGGGTRDHALTHEAHPAHLIAADAGRVRRRVNPRDKPLAIIGVVTAIGAVFPAAACFRLHGLLPVCQRWPHRPCRF